jgi:RNA polymerase sigma-70 factor (ECF subfamily)
MKESALVPPRETGKEVDRLVDHLFRHEAGRLIAILTRALGPENLDLAEDVAQEALIKALEVWPYHGIPENPTAWLAQVAKNRALNVLKRERVLASKSQQVVDALDRETVPETEPELSHEAPRAMDDVVRLMFVACHPALSAESRVALTLKTVAGFSVEQIASALLAQRQAVEQRLVRAKKQIRGLGLTFDVPTTTELPGRLDSVLEVLYLLFTEGYSAHDGDNLIRGELCDEAIRLSTLISSSGDGDEPRVHALLALMLLQAARLPARTSAGGELLLLEQQDRSLWNKARIAEGFRYLEKSTRGDQVTGYHLEAGIAACHAATTSYENTDWSHILELYEQLLHVNPSPVVALNRAVAVSLCHGPEAALRALDTVRTHPALQRYYLLWAILAKLHAEVGDAGQAETCYREALACPCSTPERRFLEGKLASLPAVPFR